MRSSRDLHIEAGLSEAITIVYHVFGGVSCLQSRETWLGLLPSSPWLAGRVPDCSSSCEVNFSPVVSLNYLGRLVTIVHIFWCPRRIEDRDLARQPLVNWVIQCPETELLKVLGIARVERIHRVA